MFVVGSHVGFVIVFEDLGDLSTVISHLQSMLVHAQDNEVPPPPHLYGVFSKEVSRENQEAFLKSLKGDDAAAGSMIVTLDVEDSCCGDAECKCEEDV